MAIIEPEFFDLTRDLDVQAFWTENEACMVLSPKIPRCPASFSPDDHWLFEFMRVPSTVRYYRDKAYRDNLHREVNTFTREWVGKVFFEEDTWVYAPRRIENLFGSEFTYHEGSTPWLRPVTDDPGEFSCLLDQVEKIDLKSWSLPEDFREEWEQRKKGGKPLPLLGGGSRGPATVITSVLKPETAFLWMYDHPSLMRRFCELLAAKMVEHNQVLREFSNNTQVGWWITDDNCALFNRALYQEYCFPVLARVLEAFAPLDRLENSPGAVRYQHSDSAMGHLIDLQYELGIRAVNYGPQVDAALIRAKMPEAVIFGQMPPFMLRNGGSQEIQERLISDFRKAGRTRRLVLTTAGSLAAGTGLGRMRWFMKVVQEACRYDV
jgi:uroporphyrinogen decarboxylase